MNKNSWPIWLFVVIIALALMNGWSFWGFWWLIFVIPGIFRHNHHRSQRHFPHKARDYNGEDNWSDNEPQHKEKRKPEYIQTRDGDLLEVVDEREMRSY